MSPDAPNPAAGEHEHLFAVGEPHQAATIRDSLFIRHKSHVRRCQICGASIDLVTGERPADPGAAAGW